MYSSSEKANLVATINNTYFTASIHNYTHAPLSGMARFHKFHPRQQAIQNKEGCKLFCEMS